jgi:hypothetical protein
MTKFNYSDVPAMNIDASFKDRLDSYITIYEYFLNLLNLEDNVENLEYIDNSPNEGGYILYNTNENLIHSNAVKISIHMMYSNILYSRLNIVGDNKVIFNRTNYNKVFTFIYELYTYRANTLSMNAISTLKIWLNSTYGILSSKNNFLYSPNFKEKHSLKIKNIYSNITDKYIDNILYIDTDMLFLKNKDYLSEILDILSDFKCEVSTLYKLNCIRKKKYQIFDKHDKVIITSGIR